MDIPIQPQAPIPRDRLCSGEKNLEFVYPCTPKHCTWSPQADKLNCPHNFQSPPEEPKILPNILHAIGNTPLIRLNKIPQSFGIKCEILAKCEFFNPGGSVKDRIAFKMIEQAEKRGLLKPGDMIIESTAGNTGLSLALNAIVKGYKCTLVMPMRMSTDKVDAIKAIGARVVRTPKADLGTKNCVFNVAQKLCKDTPNSIILDQFRNAANPIAHYETTAEEILYQCDGKIDAIVCGSGTGGTMTGIGRKIREKCPSCKMIGADPVGSNLALPSELNKTDVTAFELEGIGFNFVPTTLDRSVVDKWYKVSDKEAMLMARRLINEEGLLCGGSSGAAMCAAIEAAKTMSSGERLVVILADGLRNYMNKFVSNPWMKIRDYIPVDQENRWWWSNVPVKKLDLRVPPHIPSSTSCSQAIQHLKKNTKNYVFVEKEGSIIGSITTEKMLSNLMELLYNFDDPVEKVMDPVRTVDDDTVLGKICAIIQVESFVVVESKKNQNKIPRIVKYATSDDLLYFILSKNLEIKKN